VANSFPFFSCMLGCDPIRILATALIAVQECD
jgi:hypothetical protein